MNQAKLDNVTLRLRIARLTVLYHAFEDYNDELALLDPDGGHSDEFAAVQERFYSLAGNVENILNIDSNMGSNTSTSDDGTQHVNTGVTITTKKRRLKLPEASLPTFDSRYENWISFKNAFNNNMIDTQVDLSNVDKLHYLKSALIGEAANKVKIFAVDEINYSKAWEILERSYEVKRILVSRHLSALMNLSLVEREEMAALSRLADNTQQHVAMFQALSVQVGSEILVHILETKLPKRTLEK